MPHGMHPIPATVTSAGEGSLAIVPDSFLAEFPILPSSFPSCLQDTALSRRRSRVRIPHTLPR